MRGRISDVVQPPKRLKPSGPSTENPNDINNQLKQAIHEQDQTLVRLVEERRSQVRLLEEHYRDIQSQLVEAQRKLVEAEHQLKSLRERNSSNGHVEHDCSQSIKVKIEPGEEHAKSTVPCQQSGSDNAQTFMTSEANEEIQSAPSHDVPAVVCLESEGRSPSRRNSEQSVSGTDSKENVDLVLQVGRRKEPILLNAQHHHYFPSQHKRKLRSLVGNSSTTSEQTFATSALDGIVNVWQVDGEGKRISLLSSVQSQTSMLRRWPEDLAWHPSGEAIFACYTADGKDDQVAVINPSSNENISFLKEKPHEKGLINSILFLPWKEGTFFATGGCDHGVVLWKEMDTEWATEILHRSLHSSAVMGAAGMHDKPMIVSVGADKRIIGYDAVHRWEGFRYLLDCKALGLLPNPVDHNLFMVQTGAPGQQLRLFDMRTQGSELHIFGWKQESTESQSALINQSWSTDGLYIASGSADPMIHLFDIRHNGTQPSQSIRAHQKRVFKAVWHQSLDLLMSISSDLTIGLIKLS